MEILTINNFEQKVLKTKKRKRISKSCKNCRRRKVKCDNKLPRCTSCVKSGYEDCCYEEERQVELVMKELRKENEHLRLMLSSHSPATIPSTSSTSPGKTKVDTFQDLKKSSKRILYYGPSCSRSPSSMDIQLVKMQKDLKILFSAYRKSWKEEKRVLYKNDFTYEELPTILPDYVTLLELIKSFFNSIWYELYPIVDQTVVFQYFFKIFRENNGTYEISVEGDHEKSQLALILIILKFCLVSHSEFADDHLGILSTNDMFVQLVDGIHTNSNFLKRASLPTLQALFYQRIIKKINYFDGDGGDSSNGSLLFSLCFHLATSMGLHRNIDEVYKSEGEAFRKTLKCLWENLVYFDAMNSFDLGHPLHIGNEFLDFTNMNSTLKVNLGLTFRKCSILINAASTTIENVNEAIETLDYFLRNNIKEEPYSYIEKVYSQNESTLQNIQHIEVIVKATSALECMHFLLVKHYEKESNEELFNYHKNECVKYGLISFTTIVLIHNASRLRSSREPFDFEPYQVFVLSLTSTEVVKCTILLIVVIIEHMDPKAPTIEQTEFDLNWISIFESIDPEIARENGCFHNSFAGILLLKQFFDIMFPVEQSKSLVLDRSYSYMICSLYFRYVFTSFMKRKRYSSIIDNYKVIVNFDNCISQKELVKYEETEPELDYNSLQSLGLLDTITFDFESEIGFSGDLQT